KSAGLGWAVFVSNLEAAKTVFFDSANTFPKSIRSDQHHSVFGRLIFGPNVAFLNDPHWKLQRKVANPAFRRSMPVNMFGQLTLTLFDTMEQQYSRTVDFGKFDAPMDIRYHWKSSLCVWYYHQKLSKLVPHRRELHQKVDHSLDMIDQIIINKGEQVEKGDLQNTFLEENEKDLLPLMIESEKRGEGAMSNEELKSNVTVFLLAGYYTTASALAFAAY
ncbi:hypothetical protein CU098_004206, partial [Rhizopus stolonifer]